MQRTRMFPTLLASAALAALALSPAALAQQEGTSRYQSDEAPSRVRVDGDSTLHEWTVRGQVINGSVTFHQAELTDLAKLKDLTSDTVHPDLSVQIPVKKIEGEKDGLNEKMYTALKAKQHPNIKYRLTNATLSGSSSQDDGHQVQTTGELTIAGTTRTLKTPMTFKQLAPGRLQISGKTDLKMTDFKIDPPTALLGTISADDKVTVTWHWVVVAAPPVDFNVGAAHRQNVSVLLQRYTTARNHLSSGNVEQAKAALSQLAQTATQAKALASLLDGQAKEQWSESLTQLNKVATEANDASDLPGTRQRFKEVTGALTETVAHFGHREDAPVQLIRCASGSDADGRTWLQTSGDSACPYLAPNQRHDPDGHAVQFLAPSTS